MLGPVGVVWKRSGYLPGGLPGGLGAGRSCIRSTVGCRRRRRLICGGGFPSGRGTVGGAG